MNTDNWNLYYKTHETTGEPTPTQMCYEPLVSPKGDVFCMNFSYPCEYQSSQIRQAYTKDFVDFTFTKELMYLNIYQKKPWAPEVLEVDIDNQKIFFKWYGATCNDVIYKTKTLDQYPDWQEQLFNIITHQHTHGVVKPTVYPHSHYFDNNGKLHAFDFYSCMPAKKPLISIERLVDLISNTERFDHATEGTDINVETLFKQGLLEYSQWPGGLKFIYDAIYPAK